MPTVTATGFELDASEIPEFVHPPGQPLTFEVVDLWTCIRMSRYTRDRPKGIGQLQPLEHWFAAMTKGDGYLDVVLLPSGVVSVVVQSYETKQPHPPYIRLVLHLWSIFLEYGEDLGHELLH